METASRVSWKLYRGPIPEDKWVLHKLICPTVLCVNPDHLYLGTRDENAWDAKQAGKYHSGADNGNSKLTAEDV